MEVLRRRLAVNVVHIEEAREFPCEWDCWSSQDAQDYRSSY